MSSNSCCEWRGRSVLFSFAAFLQNVLINHGTLRWRTNIIPQPQWADNLPTKNSIFSSNFGRRWGSKLEVSRLSVALTINPPQHLMFYCASVSNENKSNLWPVVKIVLFFCPHYAYGFVNQFVSYYMWKCPYSSQESSVSLFPTHPQKEPTIPKDKQRTHW